jgi:hypothetical protein
MCRGGRGEGKNWELGIGNWEWGVGSGEWGVRWQPPALPGVLHRDRRRHACCHHKPPAKPGADRGEKNLS